MAGIYIHIPFCRQACHYCDFHFSTSLRNKDAMIGAIKSELQQRRGFIEETVSTIYFGGGTPSMLSPAEIQSIITDIYNWFDVKSGAEITLEANPDDLTQEYLAALKQTPVNRLSIGIQSFKEYDLKWMNRAHNAEQAVQCVKDAAAAGFNNISIDLIYGIPGLTPLEWQANLEVALSLPVQHLSCYCLTVEPKTALGHFVKKEFVQMPGEEEASSQFRILLELAKNAGFIHYEISNLAKPGYISQHNSSYWKGIHYLGVGPSAHSYNGEVRSWNVSNNALYIKSVTEGNSASESETLTAENRFNEYIMVSLRTMWGIDLEKIKADFGDELTFQLLQDASAYIASGHLLLLEQHLILSEEGKLIADRMAAELFI